MSLLEYRAKVGAITYIAIAISQIGDIKDPSGRLPPSQHHKIAAELLFACSAAKDVMATLQIMSAYWLSTEHELPRAKEIASNFTKQQINECMAMLEQLSDEGDTDCMTMRARMLEKVGHRDIAKGLYRSALAKAPMVFDPKWPHPMALPWVPPWIALADLLLADKHNATLDARAQAKAVLEKGAFAADDPLAYYRLASFENGHTPDWVQYMSKAAASGHIEAAYKLGRFYMDVHANPKSFLAKSQFKSALNFITSFKGGSADRLAREWLEFAASTGHKPSMLELMKLHDDAGDHHTAAGYLRRITEAPENGSTEEWPNVVREARRRSVTGKVARITA
jgi:TPR repeat protein